MRFQEVLRQKPLRERGEHYQAAATIVTCLDEGFRTQLLEFLRRTYTYHPAFPINKVRIDEVRVAGGAKDLVRGEPYLVRQVITSLALHHAPEVLLFVHENCGAYGSLSLSGRSEQEFLAEELVKAARVLVGHLRAEGYQANIRLFVCGFEGISEVVPD